MCDLIRDSAVGQILRILSKRRIFPYPEDYRAQNIIHPVQDRNVPFERQTQSREKIPDWIEERLSKFDKTKDGITIVSWYSGDDSDNPQNWTLKKKLWTALVLLLYTFAAYIGASIYSASLVGISEAFHVSETAAAVGFTLYVVGYGIGPLLFSPLSEVPAIGRNLPYVTTFPIFVILCVPTALVNNFAGLLVLRFLLGIFSSPCLATAGASNGDFWSPQALPYAIMFWGGAATLAPALGPVIAGFAVQAEGWRWSSWELLWLSGPVCILMLVALPETSADTILLRRAQRLRAATGRTDLRSASEIKQAKMKVTAIAFGALIKPWQINLLDPAVLFTTIYTAITYGLYYSYFESFPLVYEGMYGFNLGESGLAFLAVFVGLIVAMVLYSAYFKLVANPAITRRKAAGEDLPPEFRLRPGLIASLLIPAGLFLYAWTARPSIHWIVSLIGVGISMCGVFIIVQCMVIYLPFTYPQYAGSLFAANCFARATFAGGAILFARPMFDNLGVAGGASLLASLTVLCVLGIWWLYIFGERLRRRSRFAVS